LLRAELSVETNIEPLCADQGASGGPVL